MINIPTSDDPVIIASQALSCARHLRAAAKPGAVVPLAPEAQRRLQGLLGAIDQNGLFSEPVLDQLSTLVRWWERVPAAGPGTAYDGSCARGGYDALPNSAYPTDPAAAPGQMSVVAADLRRLAHAVERTLDRAAAEAVLDRLRDPAARGG